MSGAVDFLGKKPKWPLGTGDIPPTKPKEKTMPVDFKAFSEEIIGGLISDSREMWDSFSTEQKQIVERAARDLAEATLMIVQDPDNADVHKSTILHIKSTLITESTLAAVQVQNKLKESAERALMKLAKLGLAMLI